MRKFTPYGGKRFAHQSAGLRKVVETRGRCALLFDAGTGKTATALDYLSALAQASGQQIRALVISPLAAVDTWVTQAQQYIDPELELWAEALGGSSASKIETIRSHRPDVSGVSLNSGSYLIHRRGGELVKPSSKGPGQGPGVTLISTNYNLLSQRRQVSKSRTIADKVKEAIRAYAPHVLIADESHRLKSPTSNVSRMVSQIAPYIPRRLLLTGTVMPHSPLDVWAQWRILDPLALSYIGRDGTKRPQTFAMFRDRYAIMGGWQNRQVLGFQRLDQLREIMAANSIVAKKTEVLDLPPVTDATVSVRLSPREQSAYDAMKKQLALTIDASTAVASNRLTQIMRLRQLTSGYIPDDQGQVIRTGHSKVNAAVSLVRDTLGAENRIVVFAHFRHEIAELTTELGKLGEVLTVTGDVPQSTRMAYRAKFKDVDNHPQLIILVAQSRTMSLAVNELVAANHCVFVSLSQQRDDYEQARARLDRQGQTRPVTIWHLVVPGSIDEVILRSHQDRTSLEAALINYINRGV